MYSGSVDSLHQEYIRKLMTQESAQKKDDGKIYKLTNDPRVTSIGRIIRKLSIDEFPQLFNVLKGEMSMVGPRPAIYYELDYYDSAMLQKFSVKPGITGLWQISGRSSLDYRDMVALDVFYANNLSIWLDCRILLKTVLYVLKGSHAY
jgi:lipopolysaccharide/colanic/teichoic acid biosynthesis glycosyltransferase